MNGIERSTHEEEGKPKRKMKDIEKEGKGKRVLFVICT